MKFVQLFPFYESYVRELYNSTPDLSAMSSRDQVRHLIADSFAACHMIAPYMERLGYETTFVPVNVLPAQAMWAKENGVAFTQNSWAYDIARAQIEKIKPDILYISDTIGFDSSFIALLTHKPKLVFGWRGQMIPPGTDWSKIDVILSNTRYCLEKAIEHGAGCAEFFMPGFPEHVLPGLIDTKKNHDVVFSGQIVPGLHDQRNNILLTVGRLPLQSMRPIDIAYFLNAGDQSRLPAGIAMHNLGARWGLAMHRAIRGGRIVLNPICDPLGDASDHINMRHFEITGTGSFMLTTHHEAISRFFELGKEIETYRDINELTEKIHYFLDHPSEREQIALAGQRRCLRDYTLSNRAEDLDALIKRHLNRTSHPARKGSETIVSPVSGSDNVLQLGELSVNAIKTVYQSIYGIDTKRLFKGHDKITLYLCQETGYRFFHPFDVGGDAKFYEELSRFPWYYMKWKWEHEVAKGMIHDNSRLLEIGCGKGGFIGAMARIGHSCTGLELNESACIEANSSGAQAICETLPVHAGKFPEYYDIVCSFQVLEHIPEVREFILNSLKALKPAGKLIISVPNNDSFLFKLDNIQILNRPPHHLGLWTTNALIGLTRLFPLRLESIEYEPVQPYHYEWANSLLASLNNSGNVVERKKEIESLYPYVNGHTILACFSKL